MLHSSYASCMMAIRGCGQVRNLARSSLVARLVCRVKSAKPEPMPFGRITDLSGPLSPWSLSDATKSRWTGLLDRSLHGSHHIAVGVDEEELCLQR